MAAARCPRCPCQPSWELSHSAGVASFRARLPVFRRHAFHVAAVAATLQDARTLAPWSSRQPASETDRQLHARLLQACLEATKQCNLDLGPAQVEHNLQQLLTLLPELRPWLDGLESGLLAALLMDPPAVQRKLLELKAILPGADVGLLVARQPGVLFEEAGSVQALLERLCEDRGIEDLNQALQEQPRLIWDVINYLHFSGKGMV